MISRSWSDLTGKQERTIPTPAERILLDLGITAPKDIDLDAIAWTRGAVVHYRPLDKCEATIVGSHKRAVITVNSRSIPTRRRFSLAHEMGHWHFHKGRVLYCAPSDVGNPAHDALNPERQADDFASDLILPNYLFRPFALKLEKPSLPLVREIAEEFQASVTATLLKLVQNNLFPIILICHTKSRRRWFRKSALIPNWWFPREDLDPDSFAFDMLFKGTEEDFHPRRIGAGAWFTFRNCDRFEIQEQSFRLPLEQVLTVLTLPPEAIE
jgi:Zn-dependent peptidase ImmA (M78 family)